MRCVVFLRKKRHTADPSNAIASRMAWLHAEVRTRGLWGHLTHRDNTRIPSSGIAFYSMVDALQGNARGARDPERPSLGPLKEDPPSRSCEPASGMSILLSIELIKIELPAHGAVLMLGPNVVKSVVNGLAEVQLVSIPDE